VEVEVFLLAFLLYTLADVDPLYGIPFTHFLFNYLPRSLASFSSGSAVSLRGLPFP